MSDEVQAAYERGFKEATEVSAHENGRLRAELAEARDDGKRWNEIAIQRCRELRESREQTAAAERSRADMLRILERKDRRLRSAREATEAAEREAAKLQGKLSVAESGWSAAAASLKDARAEVSKLREALRAIAAELAETRWNPVGGIQEWSTSKDTHQGGLNWTHVTEAMELARAAMASPPRPAGEPPPPETLIGALHDRIAPASGKLISAAPIEAPGKGEG